MGLRNSAPVKIKPNLQLYQKNKKASLSDFTFIKYLEKSKHQFIQNWIVEYKPTKEILILKEIGKIDLYNECQIENYLRFQRLSINLHSPFIIRPLYTFQDLENIYIVMQFLKGGELSSILKYHVFTEQESKILISCLLQGLELLHSNKMILSSLKPDNIMIDENGFPKIMDLNDCLYFSEYQKGPEEVNITIYLAPEILMRRKFGPEADYYSLGIILYEMMTTQKPLELEATREETIEAIINKQIQVKKSELPEGWSLDAGDFINKLLQKNPFNRLGYYGIFELRKHNWLQGMDWIKMLQQQDQDLLKNDRFQPFIPRLQKIQKDIKLISPEIRKKRRARAKHSLLAQHEFQNLFLEFDYQCDFTEFDDNYDYNQKEPQQKYLEVNKIDQVIEILNQ